MEYYVGLDVSLKQTSICVVNQTGSIVQEGVIDSDPEAIASFVRSRAPGTVRIGIETGPTTTWLWTELKRLGLSVICIDARHARAVLKMQTASLRATATLALLSPLRLTSFMPQACSWHRSHHADGLVQRSTRQRC